MVAFLLRRLGQAALVLLVVGLGAFALFRYVGDPVDNMVGQDATPAQREQLRADLGLDRSSMVQFARFAGRAVRGDFGLSLRQGRQVSALIAERLPATLELSFVSSLIAIGLGIPLGVYVALRRETAGAKLTMFLTLIGVSLPGFLIGVLTIEIFSVKLGWLPSYGRGETRALTSWWSTGLTSVDGWRHLVLPAVTLALYPLALILRLVRAEMLEVLRAEFIKFARARGLPDRVIHFRHALRNTLIPVLTVCGLQLGGLIAFAVVTESVFAWPGLGNLFIQAVQFADIPVMAAYLCMAALVFVTINLIVDVLYLVVDPRLRGPMRQGALR